MDTQRPVIMGLDAVVSKASGKGQTDKEMHKVISTTDDDDDEEK